MYKFGKPNWDFWIKPDNRVRLWEGICLMIDMEPPRPFGHEIGHLFELKNFPKEFHEAWDILNRDENFSKLEEVGTAGRMLHSINLDGFANWAMYKGLNIPVELREIGERFKSLNEKPAPQKSSVASLRVKPRGGDALTRLIWEICYDLAGTEERQTPGLVMRELKIRAQSDDLKRKFPLMWPTTGGVQYEDIHGDPQELSPSQLKSRIKEWKKANE
jgi:hypothetical protein